MNGFTDRARKAQWLHAGVLLAALGLVPCTALAQTAGAQSGGSQSGGSQLDYGDSGTGDDSVTAAGSSSRKAATAKDARGGTLAHRRSQATAYLELSQTVLDNLSQRDTLVTYTSVAAGGEVALHGRSTEGTVSLRYEHRFVETGGYGNEDLVSGFARVHRDVIGRNLGIDAGGLAAISAVGQNGNATLNTVTLGNSLSQIWSVFAGPTLDTHAGDVAIRAAYSLGYTGTGQLHAIVAEPSGTAYNLFNHSVSQQATASAGVRPGVIAPVGLRASASWLREDVAYLGQRLDDRNAGLRATLPVSRSLALVGDLGWEHVRVSQHDALRDADGNAIVAANGQYVTDTSSPRQIAYDVDGLTWDGGVLWRPSRRTSLEAFAGRRYDSMTYYGTFVHNPNARSTLTVSVYDGISGFGSSLNDAVREMPTDFDVLRNPFTGDVGGCAVGSSGGGCVNGVLGSLTSSIFRGHGGSLVYGSKVGPWRASVGLGYAHRRYIAASNSVLASVDGTVDETWYVTAGLTGPIDRHTSFAVTGYGGLYHRDGSGASDSTTWGASATITRTIVERLTGSASVGLAAASQTLSNEEIDALARLALRYTF